MKKEILIILLLLLVSVPAGRSLLLPGGFTSHDLTHHIVRQISMDKLLKEGQFPPRWSGDLAYGYGYPVFLFNYPLPALAGEIFHIAGFNFLNSVKAVLFLSIILSALGMYLFLKSLLKSCRAAFLGAVFYLYAPIHLIVVYVSGAAGASLGLAFPPFLFWAIVKLWQGNNKFVLVGALSLAGLILSHNITAFLFAPVILAFVIILRFLTERKPGYYFFRNIILMFVMGLGLSAFFWLPALGEKQFIRYDQLMKQIYTDHFPTLRQIIYSPWGYGLSHPKSPAGGMSYQVGLIHLGVTIITIPLLWVLRKKKEFLLIGSFAVLSFIISIFFMLELSLSLWRSLPFLSYVQFPVRILIIPVFSASLLAGLLIKYLPWKNLLFVVLLCLVFYANRNHLGINQKYDPGEDYYLSLKTSSTSFDENLPIWVTNMRTDTGQGKFSFVSGTGNINILENKSAKVLVQFDSTSSAKLRFNQYYFPGWQIKVDGKKVNLNYLYIENNGLPDFDIAAGSHQILAEFKNTMIRNIADGISIISVVIWSVLLCKLLLKVLFQVKK